MEIKGARLASRLNDLIDGAAEDGDRTAVVERVARAGGISASTLGQILRAEINCPPLRRLEGFASALGVSQASLRTMAESDGCSYDEKGLAVQCTLTSLNATSGRILLKLHGLKNSLTK